MASRDREPADLRSMTIGALEYSSLGVDTRLSLCYFRTDDACMTSAGAARQDRNIGIFHTFQVGRLGYANMADGTVVVGVVFDLVIEL